MSLPLAVVLSATCGMDSIAPSMAVAPFDPRLVYEGRWEAMQHMHAADWPCSGVRLVVQNRSPPALITHGCDATCLISRSDGCFALLRDENGTLRIVWRGVRTRLLAAVSWTSNGSHLRETLLTGSTFDWPRWLDPERDAVQRDSLVLPRGKFTILLRKLTQEQTSIQTFSTQCA